MKRYYSYLVCTFVALALIGTLTTCVPQIDEPSSGYGGNGRLSVKSMVSEATIVTRADNTTPSKEELKENYLSTLDVFVEHVTDGEGDGTFLKQYHLVTIDNAGQPIKEQVDNFLAEHWRQEGLKVDQYYNIYVAVNNTMTMSDVPNVATLKALVADEITDKIAVVDGDGNIGLKGEETSGNIYKLYAANPGTYRALTSDKKFMMDGIIENWTPVTGSKDQVFGETAGDNNALILNRAAAKFVVNVSFDGDFVNSLTKTKKTVQGQETWVDKPAKDQVFITGEPAWKFYNFAFGAPVFAPEDGDEEIDISGLIHNSGFNIVHNQGYTGDDKHFTITTYSYPNKWDQANYATAAPSLVISVGYTQYLKFDEDGNPITDNGTAISPMNPGTENVDFITNYHYYRIPLVKSTVTEIERNHIYVINATIATKGSATQEDVTVTEDLNYKVLPWNDATNSEVIENNVESVQHYYFRVNPKVYTLRGNGDQSVILNYSKASGTKVNWKLFTYNANGDQTGVVAKDAIGAIRAWFYDSDGKFTTQYDDDSDTDWSNTGQTPMGVSIIQSKEGTSGSKGTITVTSTALNNKGIKYIRLRVYLDEEETFDDDGNETMYENIIIRHFPTDNIQSIKGKWSSYYDKSESSSTTTYKTTDLAEAQALAQQYGITYTTDQIETTEVISYATYSAHSSETGYAIEGPTRLNRNQFAQALTSNTQRQNANSQTNAILSDGWYYWGENPSEVSNENQSDYYTSYWFIFTFYTYYAYENRYKARYTHTYTYPEYTLELPDASTGDWVDWDATDRSNHEGQRTYTYSYTNQRNRNRFPAKVVNDNGTIYTLTERSLGGGRYNTVVDQSTGLTNNHMYVIQISSTSDEYVLGRPYVNPSTNQSQDNVVSPAFMIASQLGAVSTFSGRRTDQDNAKDAADHCSQYMEVTPDKHRYTGWRLPTAAEIKVIIDYQYGNIDDVTVPSQYRVLSPVLTGYYYWDLAGNAQRAWKPQGNETDYSYDGSRDKSYLRCVRDLSSEEIEALNGFDKIQQKYR